MSIAGRKELYFGTSVGKTFNFSESDFSDDGTPIASRIRTKNYPLSGLDVLDDIQTIFAYSDEPQGGSVSLSIDNGDYETLGSLQDVDNPVRFDVYDGGYQASLGIDEISSSNFKIKGFTIQHEPRTEVI